MAIIVVVLMNGLAPRINYQVYRRDNAEDTDGRTGSFRSPARSLSVRPSRPMQTSRNRRGCELDSLQSESVAETKCVKPRATRSGLRSTVSNYESMRPCSTCVPNLVTDVRSYVSICCSSSISCASCLVWWEPQPQQ